jgi:hypothetical protein
VTAVVTVAGVTPTPKEGRPALAAWPALRLTARWPMLWLGLFMIATILVAAFDSSGPVAWVVGLQLAGLYGFVGLSLLAHRRIMTVSRAAPISQPPVAWRLSAEGFVVSAEGLESRVAWPLVAAAVEEKDRWIFALTPNSNFILPLRVLDAVQAEAVRGLVADARTRGVLGVGVD